MTNTKKPEWLERELYDILCFLLIGLCIWMIGRQLDLFAMLGAFTARYGLTDLVMLGSA